MFYYKYYGKIAKRNWQLIIVELQSISTNSVEKLVSWDKLGGF